MATIRNLWSAFVVLPTVAQAVITIIVIVLGLAGLAMVVVLSPLLVVLFRLAFIVCLAVFLVRLFRRRPVWTWV